MLREMVVWTKYGIATLTIITSQDNSSRFKNIVKSSKQQNMFYFRNAKVWKSTWAKSNHLSDPYLSVLYNKTSKHKAKKK